MKNIEIDHYQYNEANLIGKGSSGKVFKGIDRRNNTMIAIKVVDMRMMNNEVLQFLLENQKRALMCLKSPYILKLLDIFQDKIFCYIITEYCQGGALYDYIRINKKLSEIEAMQIITKILKGMLVITENKIIHRDLKTANIMIKNKQPVIIDFGYCEHQVGWRPILAYNVGSPAYMSPQAYFYSQYSQKSDIWSLGVIYNEMITGKSIQEGTNINQYFNTIIETGFKSNSEISQSSAEILKSTLRANPSERLTCYQLINLINHLMYNLKHPTKYPNPQESIFQNNSPNKLKNQNIILNYPSNELAKQDNKQFSQMFDDDLRRIKTCNGGQVSTSLQKTYQKSNINKVHRNIQVINRSQTPTINLNVPRKNQYCSQNKLSILPFFLSKKFKQQSVRQQQNKKSDIIKKPLENKKKTQIQRESFQIQIPHFIPQQKRYNHTNIQLRNNFHQASTSRQFYSQKHEVLNKSSQINSYIY